MQFYLQNMNFEKNADFLEEKTLFEDNLFNGLIIKASKIG